MIVIQDKLVSEDLFEEEFVCNLNACKGACCIEGDYGVPLEEDELDILEKIYDDVAPYLSKEGRREIEKQGKWVKDDQGDFVTTLIGEAGPCAYVIMENGVAMCGIEKAYLDGKIDWKKPISCHLYPIRIRELITTEALNYDRWDICSPACANGKKLGVPVFRFAKDSIIRKFGESFYSEMEDVYKAMKTD